MHIRTVGKLHDTIKVQAKEIERLSVLIDKSARRVEVDTKKSLAVNFIKNIKEGEGKPTIKSIADTFGLTYYLAKSITLEMKKSRSGMDEF